MKRTHWNRRQKSNTRVALPPYYSNTAGIVHSPPPAEREPDENNPLCYRCGKRPRHRYPSGAQDSYCVPCRRDVAAANRQKAQEEKALEERRARRREREARRRAENARAQWERPSESEQQLCVECGLAPRYTTEWGTTHTRCEECYRREQRRGYWRRKILAGKVPADFDIEAAVQGSLYRDRTNATQSSARSNEEYEETMSSQPEIRAERVDDADYEDSAVEDEPNTQQLAVGEMYKELQSLFALASDFAVEYRVPRVTISCELRDRVLVLSARPRDSESSEE